MPLIRNSADFVKSGGAYILHRVLPDTPHGAVIRVYDAAGNAIATHEHKGDFKEW